MSDTPVRLKEPPYELEFGAAAWAAAIKYDESQTHLGMAQVQSLQAVDFVALGRTACKKIAFIEIKDYRQKGERKSTKDVALEVAQKVAGTMTGLASRARQPTEDFRWKAAGKQLLDDAVPLVIYLHAEYPVDNDANGVRGQLNALRDDLAAKLSWLPNCEVIACNQQFPKIPDCVMTSL